VPMFDRRGLPSRSPRSFGKVIVGLGLTAAILAGCSASPAATTRTPTSAPTTAATDAAPNEASSPPAGASGTSLAAVCRHLTNLKSMDYAFGQSFSNIAALAAASKQQTITDLQAFVQEAPPEIQPQAAALLAFWTELAASSGSVTESDPRLTQANDALGAWLTANC
jgi:hypothetical protein